MSKYLLTGVAASALVFGAGAGAPIARADIDGPIKHVAATEAAVAQLEANASIIGLDGGELFYGPNLALRFNSPAVDPRTPDIILAPKVGVVYTGGKAKVAEHGGFANDDTTVMMLVANPAFASATINSPVETAQVPATILSLLGLDPNALEAVRNEGTQVLPGVPSFSRRW
jgi:hypothetical protein